MAIENERKLLLNVHNALDLIQELRKNNFKFYDITQGYLTGAGRIRHVVPHKPTDVDAETHWFTYKTKVLGSTVEIECPISTHDYQKLFLTVKPWLLKTRTKIHQGSYNWDIDFFRTAKQGNIYLVMAEVEMPEFETDTPDILDILKPFAVKWIENGDKRFNNKNLSNPKQVMKTLASM
jgi:CYTH domain-containing protein